MNKISVCFAAPLAVVSLLSPGSSYAYDWSETSLGVRWGNNYSEPYIDNKIRKVILNLTHVSGDLWGKNLFVLEAYDSDRNDPAVGGGGGAHEIYGIFKRSFSLFSIYGVNRQEYFVEDVNLSARIDLGTKNTDLGPKPRKVRLGLSADMPVESGYWDIGVDAYHESSHNGLPGGAGSFSYDPTYAVYTSWSIPWGVGEMVGLVDFIGAKGEDGFGVLSKPSTLAQTQYMIGVGGSGLKVGVGYEYWRNKYGSDNRRDPTRGSTQSAFFLSAKYTL